LNSRKSKWQLRVKCARKRPQTCEKAALNSRSMPKMNKVGNQTIGISSTHGMAGMIVKLHMLAVDRCQPGSRTEVTIILSGDSSLAGLTNTNTLEGVISTVHNQCQVTFQAITIKAPVVGHVFDRLLVFDGEHRASLPVRVVAFRTL
jgi:hypothetical protein